MSRITSRPPRSTIVLVTLLCITLYPYTPASGQYLRGQLSGWNLVQQQPDGIETWDAGLRYLPELAGELIRWTDSYLDFNASLNLHTSSFGNTTGDIKLYRLWGRYATHRFEARFGLQKINFGPAKLLRALMWFDRLDPRDPLQITDGVTGLRLRYDFKNLSSIWAWGLMGSGETKGLEFAPTEDSTMEYGGRIQHPLGPGEIGITTHRRSVNPAGIGAGTAPILENRFALDGIWDIGIGLWFESAFVYADYPLDRFSWQSYQTAGMDYTLPLGNGLHLLWEHMMFTLGEVPLDPDEDYQLSGLMASYPLGLLDQLALYSVVSWDPRFAYHYLSWQRTYNRWVIHLGAFTRLNGEEFILPNQGLFQFGRHGIQLMIIYNH